MQVNFCFGCMEETNSAPCPRCGYNSLTNQNQSYALQQGTILHGKYLIGKMLGQGGFGITYIGWDLALSRKVAIKEFFPSAYVSRDSGATTVLQWYPTEQAQEARNMGKDMFLKEARKMNHVDAIPRVVHVLEMFHDNDTAYIVMNYIPGENLAQRIKRTGPMSWKQVQDLLLPVVDIMQSVHDVGLVHRDLSPDNLMIQPDNQVVILDLGAAKDINLQSGTSSMQVAKGGFSPMEQYVQKGNSGPWTDVYALAATIYFALTGVVPPTAVDRLSKDTLRWDLPQLRKLPTSVIRALQKAMTLSAKDRTRSMTAFADSIRKPSGGGPLKKWLAAAIAACLILAVCLFVLPDRKPEAGSSGNTTAATAPSTSPQEAAEDEPWLNNILVSTVIPEPYENETRLAPVFNSRLARHQILSVTFQDSLKNVGDDSWDVSHARDGSVIAWVRKNGKVTSWVESKRQEFDAYDLYIAAEGGINGKYCDHLFSGFINVKSIHFNDCFHTDYAESMAYMFSDCQNLTGLTLSSLNTSRVRSMANMFAGYPAKTLDVSSLDTSNVENMSSMFRYCDQLTHLDLSNFNTSKVTNMSYMFMLATELSELDIRSFDTSHVTEMSFMFYNTGLTSLDLTHFDTSKVTSISYMFSGNKNLTTLDTRGWDTCKVTFMDGVFSNCDKLNTVLGISDWDTSSAEYYTNFMDEGTRIDGKPWEDLFQ